MNPRSINIADFNYVLPEEKIAAYPLEERDSSKLLIWRDGKISEDLYRNISSYIPQGSTLVFNDTKVVESRILFKKETGGVIEVFALEPGDMYPGIHDAMQQRKTVFWKCLVGGASKWKHGQVLENTCQSPSGLITLNATIRDRLPDCFLIELSWHPAALSFAEILHFMGIIPLPPYIKREVQPSDAERYQTIYAMEAGSIASPTAGLHFTESIFKSLDEKKIDCAYVTLHVGAGTFRPVKCAILKDHEMHSEFIEVSINTIRKLLATENLFAVGTTSLRTLESLFWMGAKLFYEPTLTIKQAGISQWEVYEKWQLIEMKKNDSLNALLTWMEKNSLDQLVTQTQLLVAPGYRFRMIKGLVTNFHMPQTTLLVLVAALVGESWKNIYTHALQNGYRFLSYGDGCLIFIA